MSLKGAGVTLTASLRRPVRIITVSGDTIAYVPLMSHQSYAKISPKLEGWTPSASQIQMGVRGRVTFAQTSSVCRLRLLLRCWAERTVSS
jgi:hypothetical protein